MTLSGANLGPTPRLIAPFPVQVESLPPERSKPEAWASRLTFVGLLLLSFANIRAWRGHFGPAPKDHLGVEVPGIYWHFVDVMWIIVYSAVYLL